MSSPFRRPRRRYTLALSAISLGLCVGAPALAGVPFSPASGAYRHDGAFARFCRDLNLSDDQKAAIRPLFVDFQHRASDIRSDNSLDSAERAEKLSDLRYQTGEDIKKQLNSDQRAKFDGMWYREDGGMIQRLTVELNLTSDQRAQIRSVLADYRIRAAAIRTAPNFAGEDNSAELKDLRQQTRDEIRKALTADQTGRFDPIWIVIFRPVNSDGMRTYGLHVAENTDNILNHLAWGLKLSDEQERQFRPIVAEYERRFLELRNDSSMSADDKRFKQSVANDRAVQDMKRLLNPDQLPKFDDVWDRLMYR